MNQITINAKKIALVSDVHWGKSRDSDTKLKVINDYFDWYLNLLKEKNVDTILFLGDWFDNRNLISVKTQNQAYDVIRKISEAGITMYMIIGNHDAYFKNTIEVNSIKPYSDIKNIYPIQDLTQVKFSSGKTGLLCPWDTFDKSMKDKYDVMFGHFEFQGAYLTGSVSTGALNVGDILKVAPLAFGGHYHLRNAYKQKNGTLVTVGCPAELDWGDTGNEKGVYILDTESMNYEYIKNDLSPKHIKIHWSKIKNKVEDFSKIEGNYVKFVIDTAYKFEHIMKVINIINALNPLRPCETDFVYSNNMNALDGLDFNADDKILSMSKIDYMIKYIEEYFKNTEEDEMDIDKMVQLTEQFYKSTTNE